MEKVNLTSLQKRALQKFIPALADRDDFLCETSSTVCEKCGGEDYVWKYKFPEESTWQIYKSNSQCKDCDVLDYLKESRSEHLAMINDALMERYWFIPDDLQNVGFKTFLRTNPVTSNAANLCIDYVRHFKSSSPNDRHNLLIMGNPGTGKSHLSMAIARTLKAAGYTVGFLTTGKLMALIKDTYKKGASYSENRIFEDIKKFYLLVLDDLGSEQGTRDEFSWAKSKIFEIVNLRINKPTIYTTNFNDLTLSEAVGERVASRLYNKSKFIDLFTEDYRKKLQVVP